MISKQISVPLFDRFLWNKSVTPPLVRACPSRDYHVFITCLSRVHHVVLCGLWPRLKADPAAHPTQYTQFICVDQYPKLFHNSVLTHNLAKLLSGKPFWDTLYIGVYAFKGSRFILSNRSPGKFSVPISLQNGKLAGRLTSTVSTLWFECGNEWKFKPGIEAV